MKPQQNKSKIAWLIPLLLLSQMISQTALALDWSETNKAVTDEFAIPRFEQLHDSSKQLVAQTETFCQKGGNTEFEKTRGGFHKVMDAWQHIQILRTGPQEIFMRNFRLQMWPDRSNAGAKQIRKLLANKDPEAIKADSMRTKSVAVQGLSAMERLLFAKEISGADFYTEGKAQYSCQLLEAIAVSINTISAELLNEWQGKYKNTLATPNEKNDAFETDKEVASMYLKEIATQLQAVYELKFKRPLDKRFRLKRAESWRSSRSLRNITLNLESTEKLFQLGFSPHITDDKLKKKVSEQFKQAIETGRAFTMSLQKAHEEKPEALAKWKKQVNQLRRTVTVDVAKALDISLGFNALDGDG